MVDDDGNFSDDIVLAANDAEKARIYGDEITFLRRRIRQVNSLLKRILFIDILLVIIEIPIGCMVEKCGKNVQSKFI